MTAYAELEIRFTRIAALESASGLLEWDTAVMMPDGAGEARAEQIAVLRGLSHDLVAAPEMADLLARAEEGAASLDGWQAANLREMRLRHAHATALPRDLVEAAGAAAARCELLWREARAKSDYAMIRDKLAEVLTLQRRIGEAKAAAFGMPLYDALLENYDPGLRADWLENLFAGLRGELPGLVNGALEAQTRRGAPLPFTGPFPVATQREIGRRILEALGFDFAHGRFDVSHHPFCGGATGDVRITTRYDESDFRGALMGLLHEGGHALYEQGRPKNWLTQPVGHARGMSLHESQSLLVERHAGLSSAFLGWLAPLAREAFGADGPEWAPENFYRDFTRVERGFIRVDADEVTYPAHVILRFELERAIFSGDLALADLPGAFNEKVKAHLGLDVPDDAHGCLQDIHWYAGIWGYFPTYCVGAMTAAQLYAAATQQVPDAEAALARGDFAPLRAWLRTNVHEKGSRFSTDEIVTQATGEPLDARYYLAHLRARYLA